MSNQTKHKMGNRISKISKTMAKLRLKRMLIILIIKLLTLKCSLSIRNKSLKQEDVVI